MIKSYLLSSWRNLLKNKFYSLLNIAGLTVGLAVGILILLWVQDERSFDAWHSQAASIYRLENRVGTGGSKQIWEATVAPIGPLAKKELPEVKDMVRVTGVYNYLLFSYGDKSFEEERMAYTDASLFTVFDFPLVRGNGNNPFPDIHSVVLTASTARKYFGDEDPIGKTLIADRKTPFKVTGVIADIPRRSSWKVDMFFPMALMESTMYTEKGRQSMMTDFGSSITIPIC